MVKLGPTGNCLWNKTFGNNAHITGGVVDAAGNFYVAGYFFSTIDLGGGVLTAGAADTFVAKYTAAGVYQWGKQFGDGASQEATGTSIDSARNLYVTGFFVGQINFGGGNLTSAGSTDVYLAKLTSAGAYVWAKGFGDGSAQRSYGVATDSSGNTVVTGTYQGTINFGGGALTNAASDVVLAKYSSTGAFVWAQRFGDVGTDQARRVWFDLSGNLFATGISTTSLNFGGGALPWVGGEDIWLVKLGP